MFDIFLVVYLVMRFYIMCIAAVIGVVEPLALGFADPPPVVRATSVVLVPTASAPLPRDAVLCATVVQQHGKGFQCFANLEPIELSRLGSGAYSVTLELRRRPAAAGSVDGSDSDVSEWARMPGVAPPHTLRFRVELPHAVAKEPAMYWVFPRNLERLSTGSFDMSLRVEASMDVAAAGLVHCVAVDAPLPARPRAGERGVGAGTRDGEMSSGCFDVVLSRSGSGGESEGGRGGGTQEVVLRGSFAVGAHVAHAALYDRASGAQLDASTVRFDVLAAAAERAAPAGAAGGEAGWGANTIAAVEGGASDAAGAAIEVVVMSVRSHDRYEEALTMIKSMVLHRRRRAMDRLRLNINVVTDAPGRRFFGEAARAIERRRDDVRVVLHDFTYACAAPVDAFLREFNFRLTAHYSGRAGFCRLFFPDTLPATLDAAIALESDQLFFRDVGELWREFKSWSPTQAIGIPELYKPWRAARGGGEGAAAERQQQRCAAEAQACTEPLRAPPVAASHNGVIGGVVMYNLTRLRALRVVPAGEEEGEPPSRGAQPTRPETGWGAWWRARLRAFAARARDRDGAQWAPVLNDQDVLNAVLTLPPPAPRDAPRVDDTVLYTVPCAWQLQYHAYLDEVRFCGTDGVGSADHRGFSCPAAASDGAFLCREAPGLVHYMASSYRVASPSYYTEFWAAAEATPLDML